MVDFAGSALCQQIGRKLGKRLMNDGDRAAFVHLAKLDKLSDGERRAALERIDLPKRERSQNAAESDAPGGGSAAAGTAATSTPSGVGGGGGTRESAGTGDDNARMCGREGKRCASAAGATVPSRARPDIEGRAGPAPAKKMARTKKAGCLETAPFEPTGEWPDTVRFFLAHLPGEKGRKGEGGGGREGEGGGEERILVALPGIQYAVFPSGTRNWRNRCRLRLTQRCQEGVTHVPVRPEGQMRRCLALTLFGFVEYLRVTRQLEGGEQGRVAEFAAGDLCQRIAIVLSGGHPPTERDRIALSNLASLREAGHGSSAGASVSSAQPSIPLRSSSRHRGNDGDAGPSWSIPTDAMETDGQPRGAEGCRRLPPLGDGGYHLDGDVVPSSRLEDSTHAGPPSGAARSIKRQRPAWDGKAPEGSRGTKRRRRGSPGGCVEGGGKTTTAATTTFTDCVAEGDSEGDDDNRDGENYIGGNNDGRGGGVNRGNYDERGDDATLDESGEACEGGGTVCGEDGAIETRPSPHSAGSVTAVRRGPCELDIVRSLRSALRREREVGSMMRSESLRREGELHDVLLDSADAHRRLLRTRRDLARERKRREALEAEVADAARSRSDMEETHRQRSESDARRLGGLERLLQASRGSIRRARGENGRMGAELSAARESLRSRSEEVASLQERLASNEAAASRERERGTPWPARGMPKRKFGAKSRRARSGPKPS